jgi:hypothetical protein
MRLALLGAVALVAACGGTGTAPAPPATNVSHAAAARAEAPRSTRRLAAAGRRERALREDNTRRSNLLEGVASELLPIDPTVYCWNEEGWEQVLGSILAKEALGPEDWFDGYATIEALRIDLSPWVCETLARGAEDVDSVEPYELADALLVFTHETRHLTSAGVNEALAECVALQKLELAADAFGWEPTVGSRLTTLAWNEIYPQLPAEYRSPECRSGGTFDLHPTTSAFP